MEKKEQSEPNKGGKNNQLRGSNHFGKEEDSIQEGWK